MNKFHLLLVAFFALLYTRCTTVYIPNSIHTPMHQEKGDFSSSVGFGTNALDGNVSYSPLQNFALTLSGSSFLGVRKGENDIRNYWRYNFDLAPGYYREIAERTVFELSAGYGRAMFKTRDNILEEGYSVLLGDVRGEYQRFFLQSGIAYRTKDVYFVYAFRFSELAYRRVEDDFGKNLFNGSIGFFDQSLKLGAGNNGVTIFAECGLSLMLTKIVPSHFSQFPFIFQVGAALDYRKLHKRLKDYKNKKQ